VLYTAKKTTLLIQYSPISHTKDEFETENQNLVISEMIFGEVARKSRDLGRSGGHFQSLTMSAKDKDFFVSVTCVCVVALRCSLARAQIES
jgi:hypothetical protein